jgi:hypothetical protein
MAMATRASGIVHGLDAWLWRRGIGHPVLQPLVRNEILLAGVLLLLGTALLPATGIVFWLAVGQVMSACIFWSLSRFFLRHALGEFSSAFLRVVLVRWGVRLLFFAGLVYACLVFFKASPFALLTGLTLGLAVALATYSVVSRVGRRVPD